MSKLKKRHRLLLVAVVFFFFTYIIYSFTVQPSLKQDTRMTEGELCVEYIDVGQGDCTLISKGEFHMLIDAGDNQSGEKVVSYLKKKGIQILDLVIGTHGDSDHIGGMDDVLNQLVVKKMIMNNSKKKTRTYQEVEDAMEKKHIVSQKPKIGEEQVFSKNVHIRILSPSKTYSSENNNSIVVQLGYGKSRFLFMGDAEEEVLKDIMKHSYQLTCDVLKISHHGSSSGTTLEWLRRVDPVYGIISVGRDNSYGHPHQQVLSDLDEEDVQVFRTDLQGTICAISDGTTVKIGLNSTN